MAPARRTSGWCLPPGGRGGAEPGNFPPRREGPGWRERRATRPPRGAAPAARREPRVLPTPVWGARRLAAAPAPRIAGKASCGILRGWRPGSRSPGRQTWAQHGSQAARFPSQRGLEPRQRRQQLGKERWDHFPTEARGLGVILEGVGMGERCPCPRQCNPKVAVRTRVPAGSRPVP